jgi:hypothetical protein
MMYYFSYMSFNTFHVYGIAFVVGIKTTKLGQAQQK